MRPLILSLIFLLLMAPVCPAADEPSRSALETANQRLKLELELAQKPQTYFVFDLEQNRILFKAAGLKLAELPLTSVRHWGGQGEFKILTLAAKKAGEAPEREKIEIPPKEGAEAKKEASPKSGDEAPKAFALKAWELADMPETYQLVLDDGLIVSVQSTAEGVAPRLREKFSGIYWYLSRPLISDWKFIHGKPYTELRLRMAPLHAQMLYWAFNEGASCLILWPQGRSAKD